MRAEAVSFLLLGQSPGPGTVAAGVGGHDPAGDPGKIADPAGVGERIDGKAGIEGLCDPDPG